MLHIKKYIFNPFQVNTYLLYDDSKEGIVIDPACQNESEFSELESFIKENSINLKYMVNTHAHVDHIMGNKFLRNHFNIESVSHKAGLPLLKQAVEMGAAFGIEVQKPFEPDKFIDEGDELSFGNIHLKIFHTPGHSPGSIVLHHKESKSIFVGDVLFNGGIGRTDLPGGNYDTLITSIKDKLMIMDDETVVYSGHGDETTIGREKAENPFL